MLPPKQNPVAADPVIANIWQGLQELHGGVSVVDDLVLGYAAQSGTHVVAIGEGIRASLAGEHIYSQSDVSLTRVPALDFVEVGQQTPVLVHHDDGGMGSGECGSEQVPQQGLAVGVELDRTGFDGFGRGGVARRGRCSRRVRGTRRCRGGGGGSDGRGLGTAGQSHGRAARDHGQPAQEITPGQAAAEKSIGGRHSLFLRSMAKSR